MRSLKLWTSLGTVLVAVFIFTHNAKAETLASQVGNTTPANDTATVYVQTLGTGISGSLQFITITGRSSHALYGGTPTSKNKVLLGQCDDSGYSVNCTSLGTSSETTFDSTSDNPQTKILTWSSPPTLTSSKYYYLQFDSSGGSNQSQLYGNTTNNYPNGQCENSILGASSNRCTNLADLFFILQGNTGTQSPVTITSPITGTTQTVGNTILVSGACDSTGSAVTTIWTDVDSAGTQSYTSSCDSNGTYTTAQVLWNATFNIQSSQIITGSAFSYSNTIQVTLNTSGNPILPGSSTLPGNSTYNCDTGSWTDTFCYVVQFLFIPSQESLNNFTTLYDTFQSRFPFAYFYAVSDAISDASSFDGTSFPTLSFTFTNPALPSSLTALNATQLDTYAGSSNVTAFKTIITYALYIAFATMVFFTIRNLIKS